MKKSLILSVVCLLATVLTTTTASAQENADGYEWVSYTKDFPLDVAITKVRMKENIATSDFTLISLHSEEGAKCDIRLDKSKIAGTALKKLPADGEWRVYTLNAPMHIFSPMSKDKCEVCGENIQFYVNSEEYSESQLWAPVHSKFPKDRAITKVRTRRILKGDHYDRLNVLLQNLQDTDKELTIDCKNNESYSLSLKKSEYTRHTDKNGWDIYELTQPWMFAEATVSYDKRTFKEGERIGYEIEFITEEYQYKPLVAISDKEYPDLVVSGFPEPLVYTKFKIIEPIGGFATEQNRSLYERWKQKCMGEYLPFKYQGYLSGNKLYKKDGKELVLTYQIVGGCPYLIAEDDVIVSVEPIIENDRIDKELIKYENGDSLFVRTDGYIESGKIHRKAGILTFNRYKATLELPNGDKYSGTYRNVYDTGDNVQYWEDITEASRLKKLNNFYTGTLFKKDGTKIKYTTGKSEIDIANEKAAEKAKQERLYKEWCNKYGKQYVDAAMQYQIITGMPEELMKRVFICNLDSENPSFRWYYVTNPQMTYYVRVDKGTKRVVYWSK